ncbi:MAG TPA: amidohydrolase [Candidatus Korarchaeota archaeon]|nr:amidohydrolase [Candidatus Korarchaeota archaeon]
MRAIAICNGLIFTMTGQMIKEGIVLVREGKIAAVGKDLEIPPEAEVIDATGKVVMPGLIDAHSHVGIVPEGLDWEYSDANEITDPVTPQLRVIDAIDPTDQAFKDAIAGGVTTVVTGPGSANVIGGQSVVIKTAGTSLEEMILRNPAGVKMAFGKKMERPSQGKYPYPVTSMGTVGVLRQALTEARNYMKKIERREEHERDLGMEVLVKLLKREIPARIHVQKAGDMLSIIRVAKEFGFDFTMEHAREAHFIIDELLNNRVPVVFGPLMRARRSIVFKHLDPRTPALLSKAGIKVALMTDHPVIPIQYLSLMAAIAAGEGMSEDEALKAITINAAEIAGVADRVGSIEPRKDADIVIFSGHPLKTRSRVEKVLVNGQIVYDRSE